MPNQFIETAVETPKQQLEDILGFSLTGNEFTWQNNVRIKMAIDSKTKEALTSQLESILEVVEGKRKEDCCPTSEHKDDYCCFERKGFNQALDDIITALKGRSK